MGRVTRLLEKRQKQPAKSQPQDGITSAQFKASMREISSHLANLENRIEALEKAQKEGVKHGNKDKTS